jgi:hypothetical protein
MTTSTKTRDHFGPPRPTAEEAAAAGVIGWNLRCNRCGGFGATWIPKMRPGWGSLALCYPHADELTKLQRRHADELKAATAVNFEQPR